MRLFLQPISGLHQLIARKRGGAKWLLENDETPTGRRASDRNEEEAEKLSVHVRSNIAIINSAELLIHDLATSSIQSAARTLAMRDLESASMRLRRELGDAPQDPEAAADPETQNSKS